MLALNPDIVCAVIAKSRQFQVKETASVSDGDFGPEDDVVSQVMADDRDDLSSQEAGELIDDLEPDQQASLVALMWIGRGDFSADEWDDAYAEAQDNWNSRTSAYLMATPMVADYLSEGLAEMGYSCEE